MSKTLKWDIEQRCNLNCRHCRSGKQNRRENLGLFEYQQLIKKIYDMGFNKLVFTEKEPLMNKNLLNIMLECKKLGIKCSMVTNGILFNQEKLKKFSEIGIDEIFISLEGWTESDNDYVRGKGVFKRVISILDFIQKSNMLINVFIQLDVTNLNYFKIREFISFFNKYSNISIIVSIIAPIGNAEDNKELLIKNENYNYFKSEILKLKKSKKLIPDVIFSFGGPFNNIYYNLIGLSNDEICYSDCDLNDNGFTLQPDGSVVKCSALIGTELEKKFNNNLGFLNDYSENITYEKPVCKDYKNNSQCKVCIFRNNCCLCYIMQFNEILNVYLNDCKYHMKEIINIIFKIISNRNRFKINGNVLVEIEEQNTRIFRYYDNIVNFINISNPLANKVKKYYGNEYMYFNNTRDLFISDIINLVFHDLIIIE